MMFTGGGDIKSTIGFAQRERERERKQTVYKKEEGAVTVAVPIVVLIVGQTRSIF